VNFPSDKPKCTAIVKATGEQCGNYPIKGGTVCEKHGGGALQVRDKANRRLLEARVKGELERRGWDKITDPILEYADLAGEAVAFKDLARDKMNDLTEWSYVDAKAMEDARALVQVYERAMDRCDKILASTIRLGLDHEALRQGRERPSREQRETLALILDRAFKDPRVTVDGLPADVIRDAMKGIDR